jgi:hypothetical protein
MRIPAGVLALYTFANRRALFDQSDAPEANA